MRITAQKFKAATGFDPENDDLERCNCNLRGMAHGFCGWDNDRGQPVFWPKIPQERVREIFDKMAKQGT